MRSRNYIENYAGTLYYKDVKILHFVVKDRKLIDGEIYTDYALPFAFRRFGLTYFAINEFCQLRVVEDGAQDSQAYVHSLGLECWDLENLIKVNKCENNVDFYRVEED